MNDIQPFKTFEWIAFAEMVSILWALQRYRRWRDALLLTAEDTAVFSALVKVHSPGIDGAEGTTRAAAHIDVGTMQRSAAGRAQVEARLAEAGFDDDGLNAQCYLAMSPYVLDLERLMAGLRKQYFALLRELTLSRAFVLRAREIIDKESKSRGDKTKEVEDA